MTAAEKSELAHPHDLLVRNVLADADLVADLLQNYLDPKLVSTVDLDSLRRESGDTVAPGLSKLVGDLRFSARFKGNGGELKVFVFLEHQSRPDPLMSFRMLEYVCAAYRQHVPGLQKGKKFPYPLAVVLHHGETPWKKIPPMRELIDMMPGMAKDILGLPIHLIDVAAMSTDELRGHPMVCALLDSLQSASMGVLSARMPGILARLRGLGGDRRVKAWLTALVRYCVAFRGEAQNALDDLAHVFTGYYDKKEAEKMATTLLEQIQMEGIVKGEVRGEVKGQAKSAVMVLESRFGEIPAAIQKKLLGLRDARRVEKIIKLAATCQSLKEFQKAL